MMCLAVPGKVIAIKKDIATIDYGSETREANCSLIECDIGDYVIVSNKMVIDKLDEKEAVESLNMYNDAIKKN